MSFFAGGVAGAFSKTCTAPLARLAILFQVQACKVCAVMLQRREGSYGRNLVTIAHRLPYTAFNFYAYERYKSLLQCIPSLKSRRGHVGTDLCVHFIGGGLAGITAASMTYPLDLVRTRLGLAAHLK